MHSRYRVIGLTAGCLLLAGHAERVAGQYCASIWDDLGDTARSCSGTSYSVVDADGGSGEDVWSDGATGTTQTMFDGFGMFDPNVTELAPPANLGQPFSADAQLTTGMDGQGRVDELGLFQRGSCSFSTRNSAFQSAQWENRSRVTIIPFTTDNSTDQVEIELGFSFDFTMVDPAMNQGNGAAAGQAELRVHTGNPQQPQVAFNGLAQLDLAASGTPQLFNDFEGHTEYVQISTLMDAFQVAVQYDASVVALPGQQVEIELASSGTIFTDGYMTGDTAQWRMESLNTLGLSISSQNPAVRFEILSNAEAFLINAGLTDAWFNKLTSGQGFFIVVFPDVGIVFLAWFTYDTERPPEDVLALLGEPGHRWVTAQGPFDGDTATLDVYLTQGGVFDAAEPPAVTNADEPVGTITIVWHDCENATLTYAIDPPGVMGVIPLTRIVPDNVALCEMLAAG